MGDELTKNPFLLINMDLFSEILQEFIKVSCEGSVADADLNLAEFIVDIYNDISSVTLTGKEKRELIRMSVSSIKKIPQKQKTKSLHLKSCK